MDKKEFRKSVIKLRNSLDVNEAKYISRGISYDLSTLEEYEEAQNICVYMSINNEVFLDELIRIAWADAKNVYLPRVIDGEMSFYKFAMGTKLIKGAYDILEPDTEDILLPDENTLVVMPGAVFSEDKNRIGYGGGYYDRFLAKYPFVKTVACCYELQVYPEVPSEEYDIKPDIIVTEDRIIR